MDTKQFIDFLKAKPTQDIMEILKVKETEGLTLDPVHISHIFDELYSRNLLEEELTQLHSIHVEINNGSDETNHFHSEYITREVITSPIKIKSERKYKALRLNLEVIFFFGICYYPCCCFPSNLFFTQ